MLLDFLQRTPLAGLVEAVAPSPVSTEVEAGDGVPNVQVPVTPPNEVLVGSGVVRVVVILGGSVAVGVSGRDGIAEEAVGQVLGELQVQGPCPHVRADPLQDSPIEVGAVQVDSFEIRSREIRPGEVRLTEDGTLQVGLSQVCALQSRALEVGLGEICTREVRLLQVAESEVCTTDALPRELDCPQLHSCQHRTVQIEASFSATTHPLLNRHRSAADDGDVFGVGHKALSAGDAGLGLDAQDVPSRF